MEITPLGDSALIVRVVEDFERAPERALEQVLAAHRSLSGANIPGVIELAPAYTTVAIFYDPIRAIEAGAPEEKIFEWLKERVRDAIGKIDPKMVGGMSGSEIEVPVCYDTEFGFDLDEVAERAGIDKNEVINLHAGAEYRVHCVGFIGGFPFLGGLPAKIATPRRETPRKEIPAGSVGIGGNQTGVYPISSPGGWNIIGRTRAVLFDPKRNPPGLLRTGDRVRFRPISREEFERSAK